ncbi:MAG: gamma-glutamyltransferase [Gammaproteobacteria bacterium]
MTFKGAVAAGHEETARAAAVILDAGGNAFDAAVAAHFAACVAEPVLASLGGGSFLLASPAGNDALVYDFFVQTPGLRRPLNEIEFFPVCVDFGTARQEFHVGLASVATPGVVRGLFSVHRDLCRMPMQRLIEPAVVLAKKGVRVNRLQAYILDLVREIYSFRSDTRTLFMRYAPKRQMLKEGDSFANPEFADFLECLAAEGEDLFYRGEVARTIAELCATSGGYLSRSDFENYRVIKRTPLSLDYRSCRVLTNPPPSSGGPLIAFGLHLMEHLQPARQGFGTAGYLRLLTEILGLTEKARLDIESGDSGSRPLQDLLDPDSIRRYRQQMSPRAFCSRGTTQISVADQHGNLASLTTSNGEGCGYLVPGSGISLNNMLGEEDLNPAGFHHWPEDTRMSSMMAPSLLFFENRQVVLGSGGSNRLRTAILQVLVNLIDFGMSLDQAVESPRIHFEAGRLSVERGFAARDLNALLSAFPDHKLWDSLNLFFGGVHAVSRQSEIFTGAGDPRRGGVSLIV